MTLTMRNRLRLATILPAALIFITSAGAFWWAGQLQISQARQVAVDALIESSTWSLNYPAFLEMKPDVK